MLELILSNKNIDIDNDTDIKSLIKSTNIL